MHPLGSRSTWISSAPPKSRWSLSLSLDLGSVRMTQAFRHLPPLVLMRSTAVLYMASASDLTADLSPPRESKIASMSTTMSCLPLDESTKALLPEHGHPHTR